MDRDSICMADDVEDHRRTLTFSNGTDVSSVLNTIVASDYLAYSSSVSWVVVSGKAFALIEQASGSEFGFRPPRSLKRDGTWPLLEELQFLENGLTIYFKAHHNLDQNGILALMKTCQ